MMFPWLPSRDLSLLSFLAQSSESFPSSSSSFFSFPFLRILISLSHPAGSEREQTNEGEGERNRIRSMCSLSFLSYRFSSSHVSLFSLRILRLLYDCRFDDHLLWETNSLLLSFAPFCLCRTTRHKIQKSLSLSFFLVVVTVTSMARIIFSFSCLTI